MSTGQAIFKKLTPSEKKHLIEDIHSKAIPLFFKFEKTFAFKVRVQIGKSGESFFGKKPEELHALFDGEAATVIAAVAGERYFFSSIVNIENEKVKLNLSGDIFRLQRRKYKRFAIPENYPAFLSVKRVDSELFFFKSKIFDISEGGMRIGIVTELPRVESGQIVQGIFRLDERKGVEVRTYVRHVRKSPKDTYKQIIGLEFHNVSAYTKALIANQILDLQRDLFNLFDQKK